MAQVQGPTPAKRIHDETNKVLSITEVKTIMIRHSNKEGVESLTLAYIIGDANYAPPGANEDRLLGIWTAANMKQLQDSLRLVSKNQALNIIAMLEEKGIVVDGKVTGGSAPAVVDVSAEFDEVGTSSNTKAKDE